MFIVLVKWKIKPEFEEQFAEHWRTNLKVNDQRGLVGEFLCAPESREYGTWNLPDSDDPPCKIFLNVGIWEDEQAFLDQISAYFYDDKEPLFFEASRRVRAPLNTKTCRIGSASFPDRSSDGVH